MASERNTNMPLFQLQRLAVLAMVLLIAVSTLFLAAVGVYLYLMDRAGDKTVTETIEAGKALHVVQFNGLLSRSQVETTVGFYALADGISLSKGEDLVLQTRANGRRYLCDAGHRCTPLL
jgi:hypothetical protein